MYFLFEGQPDIKFELSMHGKLYLYFARNGGLNTQHVAPHSFGKPDWVTELKAKSLNTNKLMFPGPRYCNPTWDKSGNEELLTMPDQDEMLFFNCVPEWPKEENDLLRVDTWTVQNWEGLFGFKSCAAFLAFFYLLCVHVMGVSQHLFDLLPDPEPFGTIIDYFLMGDFRSSEIEKELALEETRCITCKQLTDRDCARCFCCLRFFLSPLPSLFLLYLSPFSLALSRSLSFVSPNFSSPLFYINIQFESSILLFPRM